MSKNKGGAPKGNKNAARRGDRVASTLRIQIPVTPGEHRRYMALAKRLGSTLAELARSLLDREYIAEKKRRGAADDE